MGGGTVLGVARFILQTLGLPGAGLIFLLEGLGAPVPVEVPLWILGTRIATGHSTYWQMVFFMWSTTVFGNAAGYILGYFGGRPAVLKLLQWFRVKPEKWERVEVWFQRHGLQMVVGTRWINWGFAQNMWLCGITRVAFPRFFAVMVINDFLWAMGWMWLAGNAAVWFRKHSLRFLHMSTLRLGLTAVAAVAVGLALWWLWRWYSQRREQID
jgi:membrane protein DedA with SNARE-associated domain